MERQASVEPVPGSPRAGRPDVASVLRFLAELVAWVATPWALVGYSVVLAVAADLVLIGLPTVFGTPGDKAGAPPVAVPGWATVGLVLLQLGAAVAASWALMPVFAAAAVTVLAAAVLVTEQPRWRRLLGRSVRPAG